MSKVTSRVDLFKFLSEIHYYLKSKTDTMIEGSYTQTLYCEAHGCQARNFLPINFWCYTCAAPKTEMFWSEPKTVEQSMILYGFCHPDIVDPSVNCYNNEKMHIFGAKCRRCSETTIYRVLQQNDQRNVVLISSYCEPNV